MLSPHAASKLAKQSVIDALEPCPFCGKSPRFSDLRELPTGNDDECEGYVAIECMSRDHFAGVHADTPLSAAAAWNRRARSLPKAEGERGATPPKSE